MPALKLLRMAGHLLVGSVTILLLFPHLDRYERGRRVMLWSTRFL